MTIIWVPDGLLDVASAASNLPQEINGRMVVSHALARSINLELNLAGETRTRRGSTYIQDTALNATASLILVMNDGTHDHRYMFTNEAIYRDAIILESILAHDWDAVMYNAFNDTTNQIYAISGKEKKRIQDLQDTASVHNWGITAPGNSPTIAVGASTGLTGDYNARYTYARLVNSTVVSESNPSAAAGTAQTLANQSLSISWDASIDSQVTHVRIYRTLTGGTTYFLDQTIAIGTTTLDTNTADTALGGQVETDNDVPPDGTLVAGPFYNGVLFLVRDNLLYYCKPKEPEAWPSDNFIEVGNRQNPLKCITAYQGQPYVLSNRRLWFIQGTGSTTFFPVPLETMTGAQGRFGAVGVEGHGIFHTGPDGIYLYGGGRDRKFSEARFDPLFRGESVGGIPAVNNIEEAWLFEHGNRLFFHWGVGSVLIFNLDNGKTYYYSYGSTLYAPSENERTGQFLVGDDEKKLRVLESGTQDVGSDIAWEAQSKDFTLQTRANFPRYVKYDTTGTMTGELLLDGVSHQTHAITESRNTRRRLVATGNGQRLAHKLSGSGVATIYAVESE